MPYDGPSDPDLPDNVKELAPDKRRQWIAVFNSVYDRCIKAGGEADACERTAFPQAYGAVRGANMAYEAVTIPNVPILRVGSGFQGDGCPEGGCAFDAEMLDALVEAYWQTRDDVHLPVKLGHDAGQKLLQEDGYPAAGWLANLRRVGEQLLADITDAPRKVADLIAAKAYRERSIEMRPDVKVGGKTYPWAITALAFLGGDIPAVSGLGDIAKLYLREQIELDEGTRVVLLGESDPNPDEPAQDEESGGTETMSDETTADSDETTSETTVADVQEEETMDDKAIRDALGIGSDDDPVEAINALKGPPSEDGDDVAALKVSNSQLQKRVISLERTIERNVDEKRREEAEREVEASISDGRILPKLRKQALKLALADIKDFRAWVQTLPKGVKLGELGTDSSYLDDDEGQINLAELQPTAEELKVGLAMGITREQLMAQKARDKGINLPVDFFKPRA